MLHYLTISRVDRYFGRGLGTRVRHDAVERLPANMKSQNGHRLLRRVQKDPPYMLWAVRIGMS